MKRVYAIESWCVNCRRCEVACKIAHSKSKSAFKAYFMERPVPQSRVKVEGGKALSIAINCRHCDDPKCVEGCISGAMVKNPETGVVTSNPDKCVGCRTCVSMCPYGAVFVAEVGNKGFAYKCDLCGSELGQLGEPNCVAACPNNALVFVESEAIGNE